MSDNIYIAVHEDGTKFKIGKSVRPIQRLKQISKANGHSFDFGRSKMLEVADSYEAFTIENILHRTMRRFSVENSECGIDGKTEWFSIDSLDLVFGLCESIKAIFNFKEMPFPVINKDPIGLIDPESVDRFNSLVSLACCQGRILKGFSQHDLAIAAGVSKRTVERLSRGSTVSSHSLAKILNAIGYLDEFTKLLTNSVDVGAKDYYSRKRVRSRPKNK